MEHEPRKTADLKRILYQSSDDLKGHHCNRRSQDQTEDSPRDFFGPLHGSSSQWQQGSL